MKKTYRISFFKIIIPMLSPIILSLILLIPAIGTFMIDEMFGFVIILSMIIYEIVPAIILKINYIIIDFKKTLSIDIAASELVISNEGKSNRIMFSEIAKIDVFRSKRHGEPPIGIKPPWYYYYYYVIRLKNKNRYVITRLAVPRLEKKLKEIKFAYRYTWFPFIKQ